MYLYRILIYPILLACSIHFMFGQIIFTKKYKSLIGHSCKERTDGGCEVYSYATLIFSKKSVKIISESKISCFPKEIEKIYDDVSKPIVTIAQYQIKNNKIYIKDFQYSPLIIGKKELVYKNVIFKLEK